MLACIALFAPLADPGPRKNLLEKHLTRKSILGAVQLLLAVFGVLLLVYIPVIIHCEKTMAMIIVRAWLGSRRHERMKGSTAIPLIFVYVILASHSRSLSLLFPVPQ